MEQVKLSKIWVNKSNPRRIDKRKVDLLIKSLKEFPEMLKLRPIIANKEGMILGGNMRYHALKAMGEKECWVDVAEGLSLEQEKEFIIKDNTNFGEWDFDILANEFTDLPLIDWGLDVGNLEQGNIDDFFERDDNKKEEEKKICPNCGAIL